jgi:VCBS repeat-containing protein
VAAVDSFTTNEDTTLTVSASGVLANDTDADGDALTAGLNGSVSHGTLALAANGSFTYTPAANFNGADSFTYHANDGKSDSNITTVSITVTAVNDAPVSINDSYTSIKNTLLNAPVATGVLTNDTDGWRHLDGCAEYQRAAWDAESECNGSFTYTPALNYTGADGFVPRYRWDTEFERRDGVDYRDEYHARR